MWKICYAVFVLPTALACVLALIDMWIGGFDARGHRTDHCTPADEARYDD